MACPRKRMAVRILSYQHLPHDMVGLGLSRIAIRLRDLPRECLAPSMRQLRGRCKRDSAEAEAGSVCLLWLDSLASLASLLADEQVPQDTEAQLVQLAAAWPALCAIQAKATKVTKGGAAPTRWQRHAGS